MRNRLTLLCSVMLLLGLLMGGLPAFADDPAEDDHYVLTIVDCPEDLDETLPSWKTMPFVDGTLYHVRSYYLGRGKWCFAIEAPEQRRFSAEEARQLLERAATPDDPPLLTVVDCPDDLDETVPSWTVTQVIDDILHTWQEYYLGDGTWCIVLERPEHHPLTAHEATLLWEKSIGIGREPTRPDPDDWVIIDLDDFPYLKNAGPNVTTTDLILSVEVPEEIKAGEVFTLRGTLEYIGEGKARLSHGYRVIRFDMYDGDGNPVANDLDDHPFTGLHPAIVATTPLEPGQEIQVEERWRIDRPGEYQLVAKTTRPATDPVQIAVVTVVDG